MCSLITKLTHSSNLKLKSSDIIEVRSIITLIHYITSFATAMLHYITFDFNHTLCTILYLSVERKAISQQRCHIVDIMYVYMKM